MPKFIYSNTSTLSVGSYLYENQQLTTKASAGKYSNGTDCYTVDSNGQVTSVGSCNGEPTTTTSTTTTTTTTPTTVFSINLVNNCTPGVEGNKNIVTQILVGDINSGTIYLDPYYNTMYNFSGILGIGGTQPVTVAMNNADTSKIYNMDVQVGATTVSTTNLSPQGTSFGLNIASPDLTGKTSMVITVRDN